jgi:hypothetical protein
MAGARLDTLFLPKQGNILLKAENIGHGLSGLHGQKRINLKKSVRIRAIRQIRVQRSNHGNEMCCILGEI